MFSKNESKTFLITGMHCNHCKETVEKTIKSIPNVKKVEINLQTGKTVVTYQKKLDTNLLQEKIKELDYQIEEN